MKTKNKILIVSPSGAIDISYIERAKQILSSWGFYVEESKFARGKLGRFSGTEEERIFDLQYALDDKETYAIFCSRGGYGLAQIIDKIDFNEFQKNPKWIIGFSDITVLHNALANLGIASIHGVMAKQLSELSENVESIANLKEILNGKLPEYKIVPHSLNRVGEAQGKLTGGNLSVIYGLRGTPYDLNPAGKILFIEDIGEKPYHIDRMLQNLRMGGVLQNLSALVVGQFSECEEDPLMNKSIAEIISDAVKDYDFPVCFNFPAGHTNKNLPLILGANVDLIVNEDGVEMKFYQA
jgi:Uncharacterized proteins, homologs of microcin C7 resistance protein MccF